MEILYVYIWNIIVVNIKGKHNFKHFYYIHIVEIIPTQKGEHRHGNVQSCLSNEKKEFVSADVLGWLCLQVI